MNHNHKEECNHDMVEVEIHIKEGEQDVILVNGNQVITPKGLYPNSVTINETMSYNEAKKIFGTYKNFPL